MKKYKTAILLIALLLLGYAFIIYVATSNNPPRKELFFTSTGVRLEDITQTNEEGSYYELILDKAYHPMVYCHNDVMKVVLQKDRKAPTVNPKYKQDSLTECFK